MSGKNSEQNQASAEVGSGEGERVREERVHVRRLRTGVRAGLGNNPGNQGRSH
jgi:hypothetical protein